MLRSTCCLFLSALLITGSLSTPLYQSVAAATPTETAAAVTPTETATATLPTETATAVTPFDLVDALPLVETGPAPSPAFPAPEALAGTVHVFVPFITALGGLPPGPITPPASPTPSPSPTGASWVAYVNAHRASAGVPPVSTDATLDAACVEHARYMAENNHLSHTQNPALPFASAAGQKCAQKSNVWLGSAFSQPYWTVKHSIDSWMASEGHRMWLLYPTTQTFGYGFYSAANNAAGASLDVLSHANFSADAGYPKWPIRYPAAGQTNIPTRTSNGKPFPITLNWRYLGPVPTLSASSLKTSAGTVIAHSARVLTASGEHKAIIVLPNAMLDANTSYEVQVSGTYEGIPFTLRWTFTTAA